MVEAFNNMLVRIVTNICFKMLVKNIIKILHCAGSTLIITFHPHFHFVRIRSEMQMIRYGNVTDLYIIFNRENKRAVLFFFSVAMKAHKYDFLGCACASCHYLSK